MIQILECRAVLSVILFLAASFSNLNGASAADASLPFEGAKSSWHDGFDRYDYLMDDKTFDIQPFKRGENENFGLKDPPPEKRRCVVIVPKRPAPGNPWSWRGCYWDHQPQVEVELLNRGFHVAYISANATLKPGKQWDAWYTFLTEKHGLSKKPAFVGMSRGGEYSYSWATANPDKVSCIYADNPGINPDVLKKLVDLAAADVPILHVCGSIDPLLGAPQRRSRPSINNSADGFPSWSRKEAAIIRTAFAIPNRLPISFRRAFNPSNALRRLTWAANSPERHFIALRTPTVRFPKKESISLAGDRGLPNATTDIPSNITASKERSRSSFRKRPHRASRGFFGPIM